MSLTLLAVERGLRAYVHVLFSTTTTATTTMSFIAWPIETVTALQTHFNNDKKGNQITILIKLSITNYLAFLNRMMRIVLTRAKNFT